DHEIKTCQRRRSGPRHHYLHLSDFLADDCQPIDESRRDADGRAMLIIMENWNIHALAQLALDMEAFRCLDVLEIDPAKSGLKTGNDVHQLVRILFVDFDVEHIDTCELLEEHGLAFHYRL